MMGSNMVSPEDVLETLMNDGTIDSIRLKIINQLKANEELKNYTLSMVEQSKVLNTPGAEKQTKRELFDALRQELETSVLEKASKAVWELILDSNNLGKDISETVEKVYKKLSGCEQVQVPPVDVQAADKEVNEKEKSMKAPQVEAGEREQNVDPSRRKRSYSEMNTDAGSAEPIPSAEC
ncbi:antigenic heat-stable protein [Wolffia australiana]